MQVVKVGLTSLDPQLSLMWLVLSIDCLQKCDTGAALLSTCWRRYKPPSPFITLLNFMMFTILSAPCYLFKDFRFWCLYQLCFTVYYHVDVCVVTWEHGSVNLWHPGVSWNPPQPQAGHLLTFIPIFHVEPLNRSVATRICESVALESEAETTCPCQAGHLPHPTIAC